MNNQTKTLIIAGASLALGITGTLLYSNANFEQIDCHRMEIVGNQSNCVDERKWWGWGDWEPGMCTK